MAKSTGQLLTPTLLGGTQGKAKGLMGPSTTVNLSTANEQDKEPSPGPLGCASHCPYNTQSSSHSEVIHSANCSKWPILMVLQVLHRCLVCTDVKREKIVSFLLHSSLTDLYPAKGAFPRPTGLFRKAHWSRTVQIPSTASSHPQPRSCYHPFCMVFKGLLVFLCRTAPNSTSITWSKATLQGAVVII